MVQFMQKELKELYPATEIRQFALLIFEHLLGFSSTDLITKGDKSLDEKELSFIENCTERLKKHEPVQYIIGETEFLDLKLKVNPSTLIPRPETEELVMWIAGHINSQHKKVLDIGTGSGCIALGLKAKFPGLDVEAWDISKEALKTAEQNAVQNDLDIRFSRVDILTFEPGDKYLQKYDIIISNPPYVTDSEKKLMEKNVLEHEPHTALFVEDEAPLLFYEKIAGLSRSMLKTGGLLFFEINETMGEKIKTLLADLGFSEVEIKKDLSGKNRMVKAVNG